MTMRRNYHKVSKISIKNKHKAYVRKFRKSPIPKNRRFMTTSNTVKV